MCRVCTLTANLKVKTYMTISKCHQIGQIENTVTKIRIRAKAWDQKVFYRYKNFNILQTRDQAPKFLHIFGKMEAEHKVPYPHDHQGTSIFNISSQKRKHNMLAKTSATRTFWYWALTRLKLIRIASVSWKSISDIFAHSDIMGVLSFVAYVPSWCYLQTCLKN